MSEALRKHMKAEESSDRYSKTFSRGFKSVDIHEYSRLRVEDINTYTIAESASATEQHSAASSTFTQKKSLNATVINYISSRVDRASYNADEVSEHLVNLITQYIPETAQESALQYVANILNSKSIQVIGVALTYISRYFPESTEIWIQGFLGESTRENSCQAGALERIVTGLRG
jgi:hypothetical protein